MKRIIVLLYLCLLFILVGPTTQAQVAIPPPPGPNFFNELIRELIKHGEFRWIGIHDIELNPGDDPICSIILQTDPDLADDSALSQYLWDQGFLPIQSRPGQHLWYDMHNRQPCPPGFETEFAANGYTEYQSAIGPLHGRPGLNPGDLPQANINIQDQLISLGWANYDEGSKFILIKVRQTGRSPQISPQGEPNHWVVTGAIIFFLVLLIGIIIASRNQKHFA